MTEIRERLLNCFAVVFPGVERRELTLMSIASSSEWDSLATVTLVALMEEEFGQNFVPEELEQLISFELILEILRGKLNDA